MVWSLKHRKLLHSFDVRGFLKHPNWPLRDFKVSMIFRIQIVLFNPTSESLKRYMMYMHHWQSCLICFFSEIVILFSGRLPFAVKNLHLGFLLGVKVNNQPMVLFANKFLQSTHTKNHQTKGCGGRWIASTAIKRFRRAQRLSHQGFFPVKSGIFVLRDPCRINGLILKKMILIESQIFSGPSFRTKSMHWNDFLHRAGQNFLESTGYLMQLQVGEMWIEHSAMILRSFCQNFEKMVQTHVASWHSLGWRVIMTPLV